MKALHCLNIRCKSHFDPWSCTVQWDYDQSTTQSTFPPDLYIPLIISIHSLEYTHATVPRPWEFARFKERMFFFHILILIDLIPPGFKTNWRSWPQVIYHRMNPFQFQIHADLRGLKIAHLFGVAVLEIYTAHSTLCWRNRQLRKHSDVIWSLLF